MVYQIPLILYCCCLQIKSSTNKTCLLKWILNMMFQLLRVATSCLIQPRFWLTTSTYQLLWVNIKAVVLQRSVFLAQFARQLSTQTALHVTCFYTTSTDRMHVTCAICGLLREADWGCTNAITRVPYSRLPVTKVLAVWIPAVSRYPALNLVCVLLSLPFACCISQFKFLPSSIK